MTEPITPPQRVTDPGPARGATLSDVQQADPPTEPDAPPGALLEQARRRTRRRFRTLNLTTTVPVLIAVGALVIVQESQTWWHALVLSAGILASVVAMERWTAADLMRVAVPCLAVAAVVWPVSAWFIPGPVYTGFHGLAVVGGVVVTELTRRRASAAIATVAYVAVVGAVGLILQPVFEARDLVALLIVPAGITAIVIGFMFPNKHFYDTVADMEAEHRRESELAVMRERVRFAGDLHDIQGHTLHVAKLKIALAQRLVHVNPAAAEQELGEVHDLIGDTITQAKELAYGRRRLNLVAELENARRLFEAAGITVSVDRHGEVDAAAAEMLGQVLRETTTNVLRHAQGSTYVRIVLTGNSIRIVNDGAREDEEPRLRGLATLRERISTLGGELATGQDRGRFVTEASVPGSDGTFSANGDGANDDEAAHDDHGGPGR